MPTNNRAIKWSEYSDTLLDWVLTNAPVWDSSAEILVRVMTLLHHNQEDLQSNSVRIISPDTLIIPASRVDYSLVESIAGYNSITHSGRTLQSTLHTYRLNTLGVWRRRAKVVLDHLLVGTDRIRLHVHRANPERWMTSSLTYTHPYAKALADAFFNAHEGDLQCLAGTRRIYKPPSLSLPLPSTPHEEVIYTLAQPTERPKLILVTNI